MCVRPFRLGLLLWALTAFLPAIASAQCPVCSTFEGADCCQRPTKIKVIIKRPIFNCSLQGIAPAPPAAVAVSPSVSAVLTPAFALPVNLTAQPNPASAADLKQMVDDAVRRHAAAAAPPVPAAGGSPAAPCTDVCGDIRQLQQDVKDLKVTLQNLATQVQTISKPRTTP